MRKNYEIKCLTTSNDVRRKKDGFDTINEKNI